MTNQEKHLTVNRLFGIYMALLPVILPAFLITVFVISNEPFLVDNPPNYTHPVRAEVAFIAGTTVLFIAYLVLLILSIRASRKRQMKIRGQLTSLIVPADILLFIFLNIAAESVILLIPDNNLINASVFLGMPLLGIVASITAAVLIFIDNTYADKLISADKVIK